MIRFPTWLLRVLGAFLLVGTLVAGILKGFEWTDAAGVALGLALLLRENEPRRPAEPH